MKRLFGGVGVLALAACTLVAASAFANTTNVPKHTYIAPLYNTANEITLQGTIESVVRRPSAGMLPGAHLLVSTSHGIVDAQLGIFSLRQRGASSLAPGQPVKVTGVMKSIDHQNVLVTRLIQSGAQTIEVRSTTGFLLPPGAKARPASVRFVGGAR